MKLVICGLLLLSASAFAAEVKIERFEKAQLCFANNAPGSSTALKVDGAAFLVSALNEEQFHYKRIVEENQLSGKCVNVNVTGYRVKEMGHFPNPTATFDVFKIMDLTPAWNY